MWRYFFIGFIDFMFRGKTLTDFCNTNFEKNDRVIHNYFLRQNINMSDTKEIFLNWMKLYDSGSESNRQNIFHC